MAMVKSMRSTKPKSTVMLPVASKPPLAAALPAAAPPTRSDSLIGSMRSGPSVTTLLVTVVAASAAPLLSRSRLPFGVVPEAGTVVLMKPAGLVIRTL